MRNVLSVRACVTSMIVVVTALASLAGCSSSDDGNGSSSGTQQGTSGLSAAFANNCARCHGPRGEGQGTFPRIPGSRDVDGFIALVRAGKGNMPAFDATKISDADLRADYAWLTTRR